MSLGGRSLAEAFVAVIPDVKGFEPTLRGDLGRLNVDDVGKAHGVRFGESFTSGMTTLLAGAGFGLALKSVIGAASDLNETVNKSNQIFGSSAKQVEAWSRTAATSFGLSKSQALEAAAGFGNMFTQLGFTSGASAKLSEQVVRLSADLGSFNNLPTADVADMISAAFRGEYDGLQRLIPNISAARVQQEALNETHKTNVTQLTAAEKATATLAIVQQDGAKASGDFARTADQAANSQKILTAQLQDQQAKLGQAFLPIWRETLGLVNDALGVFNALPGPIRDGAVVVGLLGTAALVAAPKILALKELMATTGGASVTSGLRLGLAGVAGFLTGPWGLAIAGGVTALSIFKAASGGSSQATKEFTEALKANGGVLDENARKLLAKKLVDSGAIEQAKQLGVNTRLLIGAITDEGSARHDLISTLTNESALDDKNKFVKRALAGTVLDLGSAFDTGSAKGRLLAEVQGSLGGATRGATGAMANQTDVAGTLHDALDLLNGKALSSRDAERAYRAAVDDATAALDGTAAALKASGTALDVTTAAGRANAAALDSVAKKASDQAAAMSAAGVATATTRGFMESARASLVTMATQFGLTKAQALAYVDQVLQIPTRLLTTVVIDTSTASGKLAAYTAQLGAAATARIAALGHAGGGLLHGAGTGTSDSLLIAASTGEYVLRAAAVQALGVPLLDRLNALGSSAALASLAVPAVPHFAAGGLTGTTPSVVSVTLENHGVIGSKIELENWLVAAVTNAQAKGRL